MLTRLLAVLLVLLMALPAQAVTVSSKTYTFTNGTANDAAPVDSEFTTLFNNDSAIKTAVDRLEAGNFNASSTITLNSDYSGASPSSNGLFQIERGTQANVGIRWNETSDVWQLTTDGTNWNQIDVVSTTGTLPRGYRGTAAPVYASATTFTVASINDRNNDDDGDIQKTGSTTVDITTTGLNGIAQSANLTGTIAVTSGSATVTGTGTNFSGGDGEYSVGKVICVVDTSQCCRITAIASDTSMTVESNFTSTDASSAHKRGGRAPNTWYYLYSTTNAVTPGLILTTDNLAGGGTVGDLPSGYTDYRQQKIAFRLDASSNIIKFAVSDGWPVRPRIKYQTAMTYITAGPAYTVGTTNVLNNGTQTAFTAVSLASFVPPVSQMASLKFSTTTGLYGQARTTGDTNIIGFAVSSGGNAQGEISNLPTNSSQSIDYLVNAGGLYLDVLDYVVDQVP